MNMLTCMSIIYLLVQVVSSAQNGTCSTSCAQLENLVQQQAAMIETLQTTLQSQQVSLTALSNKVDTLTKSNTHGE